MKHGITAYSNHGCRCDECKAARAVVSRRYRESHREQRAKYAKDYRRKNREKLRERGRRYEANYRKANREKIRIRTRKRWRAIQSEIFEILGGRCVECGTSENLQIDHIDPKTKNPRMKGPTRKVATMACLSEGHWKAEVSKCQLLCGVCRGEKSAEALRVLSPCGSRRSYQKGCHCSLCRAASNEYHRRRRVG